MADPEFDHPGRMQLIERLIAATGNTHADSMTHAILWLGDVDRMNAILDNINSTIPDAVFMATSSITAVEHFRIAQQCKPSNLTIQTRPILIFP
jgi:hypothetical protein